jgi:hypothetical protein
MIHAWAIRWSVPPAAIADLLATLGAAMTPDSTTAAPGSEAAVQNAVRMEAARRLNYRLWRNNVGCLPDRRGVPLRFGLANESDKINKIVKSSDLIGISPQGQFLAYEIKAPGWHYTGNQPCICKPHKSQCNRCHEKAQMAFLTFINSMGGRAAFITSPEEL